MQPFRQSLTGHSTYPLNRVKKVRNIRKKKKRKMNNVVSISVNAFVDLFLFIFYDLCASMRQVKQ